MAPEDASMQDIENPKVEVEISVRDDGKVLWVNLDGRCILRICQINVPIEINDAREVQRE